MIFLRTIRTDCVTRIGEPARVTRRVKARLAPVIRGGDAEGFSRARGFWVHDPLCSARSDARDFRLPPMPAAWRQTEMSRSVRVSVKTTGDPRMGSPVCAKRYLRRFSFCSSSLYLG